MTDRRRALGWRVAFGSIRTRTTLAASLVVGLALGIGALALLVTLKGELTSNQDALARARADELSRQAAAGTLPDVVTNVGDDGVAQVVSSSGEVLAASSGLAEAEQVSTVVPADGTFDVITLDGIPDDAETENYRVWVTVADSPDGPVRIYVGSSLEATSEAVAALRQALFVGIPLLIALVAGLAWLLVGRALRPVEDIRREVSAISNSALELRVPVPPGDDELTSLATTMNAMLARLEESARRQRDFVADASHELQSPLTSFRAQLEVSRAHPEGVDWQRLADDLLADSDRMERLVRDLLFLARQDSGADLPADDLVDFDDIALEEVARLRSPPGVRVDTRSVSAAPVRGSRDDLQRLVRNLLENAVAHGRSLVTVASGVDGSGPYLVVADDGPGIPVEQRGLVFDRFARLDDARSPSHPGTGLGLSIARSVARRHGGSIEIADPVGGVEGVSFVVRLPPNSRRDVN